MQQQEGEKNMALVNAKEIQEAFPGIKGFNRRGLYRMKKFYETFDSGKQNGFRHNGGKRGTKC